MADHLSAQPAHAEYSPSSLSMFDKCPSYLNDDRDTIFNLSGDRCHKAMETGVDKDLNESEQREVEWCRSAVYEVCRFTEQGLRWGDQKEQFRELRLNICGGLTFGTVDRVFLYNGGTSRISFENSLGRHEPKDPGILLVGGLNAVLIDYKFGMVPVPHPEANVQMKAYVLGVFEKWPSVQSVYCAVLQPKLEGEHGYVFSRKHHMKEIRNEIAGVINRATVNKGKEFVPRSDVCQWCGRKTTCPAIMQTQANTVGLPVHALRNDIGPDELAENLSAVLISEKFNKEVRAYAKDKIHNSGWEIPGWDCTVNAPRQTITNYIGVELVLDDQELLVDREIFNKSFKISKSSLRKAVGNAPNGLKGADLNEAMGRLYVELEERGFIITADTGDEDGTLKLEQKR